tara:strand:- start:218 stop:322 length:105 start_codon:yes stop_codon:yes gene_type:complete
MSVLNVKAGFIEASATALDNNLKCFGSKKSSINK